MNLEHTLLAALEILTEGDRAEYPEKEMIETFATESFKAEATRTRDSALNWTMGEGIQGMGIGEKTTGGKVLDAPVLKIYVAKKLPKKAVTNPIPEVVNISELGEVNTDVEEIGEVTQESFTSRVRPAMPGCGLSHVNVSVGTFGCLVRLRNDAERLFILSNSHVLADQGLGKLADAILQPGVYDNGTLPGDLLARLADFVPFKFSQTGFPNLVDAAIAEVEANQVTALIRILGIKPAGVSRVVKRGMRVKKVGRTTDFTTGVIRDINYRLALNYTNKKGKKDRVGLKDQVLCTRYTAGGDSGSAVLNSRNRIVGLHFAGSPSTSIFNKIPNVFSALKLKLY